MNHFPLMARFNGWVNDRLYDSVARLPDAAYPADRIEGVPSGIRSLDQILHDDFASLRAARRAEDRRLIELVDGLSEQRLRQPVLYRRMIGEGDEEVRAGHL